MDELPYLRWTLFNLLRLTRQTLRTKDFMIKTEDLSEKEWSNLKNHRSKLGIIHTALVDPFSVLKPHEMSVKLNEIKKFKEDTNKMAKEMQKLKESYLYVDWNNKEGKWESPVIYNEEQKSFIYPKKEASGYIVQQVASATRLLSTKLREEKEEQRDN